mgnify:CR=1 FL=1
MARASTPTLLSLDQWASIIGINPMHFNQGTSADIMPLNNTCNDLFFQFSWQHVSATSREDMAREIAKAEHDLAEYLGWPVAPMWIEQDVKMNPRFHRPEYWSTGNYNNRYAHKAIKSKYGKIIEPGQRAVTFISTAEAQGVPCSKTFSDEDGDGFDETVTISCTGITTTNACEIKVYFADHNGDPEWEIRPARTRTLVGGTFTATFWAWQLVDPALWEAFPTYDNPDPAIDMDQVASYVTEVDIYREYNDTTATSAVFYWEPDPATLGAFCSYCDGTGCVHCTLTTQDGCAYIRDANLGYLVPQPGTYSDDNAQWESDAWTVCRDPDQVKLYYYCGNISDLALANRRCDGLSDEWARIIAWMATARLPRPLCVDGSPGGLVDWLQEDVSMITREKSYTVLWDDLSNPFGVRRGELEAWRFCKNIVRDKQAGAGAV